MRDTLLICLLLHTATSLGRNNQIYIGYDGSQGQSGASAVPASDCQRLSNDILSSGGSAVDAAITAALCTGLINSYASGLGGGSFMLVKPRNSDAKMIDCREVAPEQITPDSIIPMFGGRSVAVPGELHCFETAHRLFGRLPWKSLFTGVIRLARHGFAVPLNLAKRIKRYEKYILRQETLSSIYAPNGVLLVEGQVCFKRKLADLLERISVYVLDLNSGRLKALVRFTKEK